MNKVLSLIIPTYNMEKYLDKCLTSLIVKDEKLFKNLEVLVIIDGAKDRSSEIAHTYQSRYPEVYRVIDKENGNYGSCVNRGLKEATGKYVKVLDADDYFDTNSLQDYLDYLNRTDVDLVVTDYDIVNEQGDITSNRKFPFQSNKNISFLDICSSKAFRLIEMHAITYKRQNLVDINYRQTEGVSYTDREWVFIPMTTVKIMQYHPIVLYKYLVGRAGQTIDPKVLAKTISHNVVITENRLKDLKQRNIELSDPLKKYLYAGIMKTVVYVYRNALLKGALTKEQLDQFDANIKQLNPEIYELSNNARIHKRIPFKFISYYRQCGMKMPLYIRFFFKICRMLGATRN